MLLPRNGKETCITTLTVRALKVTVVLGPAEMARKKLVRVDTLFATRRAGGNV